MTKCERCGREAKQGHPINCNQGVKASHNSLYAPAELKNSTFEQPAITIDGNGLYLKSGTQQTGQLMDNEKYAENLQNVIKQLQIKLRDFKAGTSQEL